MGILLNRFGVLGEYGRADEPCGTMPHDLCAAINPLALCVQAHVLRFQREPL